MKNLFILLIVSFFAICGCERKQDVLCDNLPFEDFTLIDSIDYDIINSVIEQCYSSDNYIHIDQSTNYLTDTEIIEMILSNGSIEFDTTFLTDYKLKNETIHYLNKDRISSKVTVISPEELTCIFINHAGWDDYYEKYPKSEGLLSFYRPGINKQKDEAIVEYGYYTNYLGAIMYIVLLHKENNNWIISHRIITRVA